MLPTEPVPAPSAARGRGEAGELACLGTFYIGKPKEIGTLRQITAGDAASSYAMAKVVLVCNAERTRAVLSQAAGWSLGSLAAGSSGR